VGNSYATRAIGYCNTLATNRAAEGSAMKPRLKEFLLGAIALGAMAAAFAYALTSLLIEWLR
jgi:hypothetical protein